MTGFARPLFNAPPLRCHSVVTAPSPAAASKRAQDVLGMERIERIGTFLSGGRLWRAPEVPGLIEGPPAAEGPPVGLTDRIERLARRLLGL